MKRSRLLLLFLLAALYAPAEDFVWPSIPPEQIAMKAHPLAVGAHAMVLDWEIMTDDPGDRETVFMRIKIFSDEGRAHGDISIPYFKQYGDIKDLTARTIHSDGTIIPFRGEVFEKMIVKTKQIRYLAKTFSFPEVEAGSILEYHYTRKSENGFMNTHTWSPQGELPVLHLDFKVKPDTNWLAFRYVGLGLPAGKDVVKNKDGSLELVLDDLPAFEEESYVPPQYELKPVVWLYYTPTRIETADEMWKRMAKDTAKDTESLLNPTSLIRDTALATVNVSDSPETKLRKLYAKVKSIRNLAYEREKTSEEEKREKLKDNNRTEDVLKHGYGSGIELNRLFIAMARSLGMDANEVFVSQRDNYFFRKDLPGEWQLNGELAEVRVADKSWFLDPAEKFCPFGLLPWQETGVMGLRVTKDGGAFLTTPNPTSDVSITERKGHLRWKDGDIEGEVTVQYKGQDALVQRLNRREDDDAVRSKEIEDEIKKGLPDGSTAKVKHIEGLDGAEEPVTVTLDVHIPNLGASLGKRLALPLNIFATQIDSAFRYEKRKYPLYFAYPYQESDDIVIDTPEGYSLDRLPEPHREITPYGRYVSGWEKTPTGVKFVRRFALDWFYFQNSDYPAVRKFYLAVLNGDKDGAIFQTNAKAK